MKILHINDSSIFGGREKFIVELCNQITKEHCVSMSILSLTNNLSLGEELEDKVMIQNLNIRDNNLSGVRLLIYSPVLIFKIRKMLLDYKPNIVHIHSFFFIYFLIAIAVRLCPGNIPVVRTVHTSGLFYSSTKWIDKIRLFVEKVATTLNKTFVVAISRQILSICEKVFTKQAKGIILIYNGIDISKFSMRKNKNIRSQWGCSDKDIIGVYVARFDYGKNQDKLVRIWKALKDLEYVKLWLIGDGPTYSKVTDMISQMKLSKNVICFGQSNNIPLILNNADFALFPSSFEGFSIALIEKCASGLSVIASDIQPFKEVVKSGEEGFLINLNDEKGWLEAIKCLATDASFRTKMGEKAIIRAKNFSMSIVGERYFNLYTRITAGT